ncbi:MAG: ATP-binding protein [Bacteroidota bacterium]
MNLGELRRLVQKGEGKQLEFKRKVSHPEKIARELVAFANTVGGTLLLGVDDNGSIPGSKSIEGEAHQIQTYLNTFCTPDLPYQMEKIPINSKRQVLAIYVVESARKPHFILPENRKGPKKSYVRVRDMSVTASREMVFIMRKAQRNHGVSIYYGEYERKLLQQLDLLPQITLEETRELLATSYKKASQTLVRLVQAGLLSIHPTEKGDYFRLAEEAFRA